MKVGRRIEWRVCPAGQVWRSLSRYEHLIGVSHYSSRLFRASEYQPQGESEV